MPLYNNILVKSGEISQRTSEDEKPTSQQNASMHLLRAHLLVKKKQQSQQILKSSSNKCKEDRTINEEDQEYDPVFPNTYEILRKILEDENRKKEKNKTFGKLDKDSMLNSIERLRNDTCDEDHSSIHIDDKKSNMNESNLRNFDNDLFRPKRPSIAANIMSRMGYKEGDCLGKKEYDDPKRGNESEKSTYISKKFDGKESRILLLRNMVGPGEVDSELESETKEECSKYGKVIRCFIYEIPNKKVHDEDAVRIFVEFGDIKSASDALLDLNGKYFGGRVVKASFYDAEKFNKYQLAP